MRLTGLFLTMALLGCGSGGRSGGGGFGGGSDAGGLKLDAGTGGSPDLAMSQSPGDMAMSQPKPDLAMGGGKKFGCASDVNCYVTNKCADQTCFDTCDGMVNTASGLMFLNDYFNCLFGDGANIKGACPSSSGGVCDSQSANYNAMNCSACVKAAQTGACKMQTDNCRNDG